MKRKFMVLFLIMVMAFGVVGTYNSYPVHAAIRCAKCGKKLATYERRQGICKKCLQKKCKHKKTKIEHADHYHYETCKKCDKDLQVIRMKWVMNRDYCPKCKKHINYRT